MCGESKSQRNLERLLLKIPIEECIDLKGARATMLLPIILFLLILMMALVVPKHVDKNKKYCYLFQNHCQSSAESKCWIYKYDFKSSSANIINKVKAFA